MAVLDTNNLIDLIRKQPTTASRRSAALVRGLLTEGESLLTTRFNVAELYVGVELSDDSADESERADAGLETIGVLEFDDAAARIYRGIEAALRQAGRPIGDFDALIASVTLRHNQRLVTRNPRHFEGIAGLVIVAAA